MIGLIKYDKGENLELLKMIINRNTIDSTDYKDDVERIIKEVKLNGDKAIENYTKEFDGVDIKAQDFKVAENEIEQAYIKTDKRLLEIIRSAASNIRSFHEKQKSNSWITTEESGVILGQRLTPMEKIGVYVPGGTAAYPSSVLMNVIPAKIAGVERIIMVTPPQIDGSVNPNVLVAAREAGVDEIYRIGGAQAVAALAFGTETIPSVDKIVGPGNIYVALAKRMVYGYVDIDMIAGPSEILIIADKSANPEFIAADLLSQAEHDSISSSVLITDDNKLVTEVQKSLERQLESLGRREIAEKSLNKYGALILVKDIKQAVKIANDIAPEHLELAVNNPFELLGSIKNAGAIFLGHYTPESVGDYYAGPNHVLPTGGAARFSSPLGVDDFVKKSSIIYYSKEQLLKDGEAIMGFADAEGLGAHANSIKVRMEK